MHTQAKLYKQHTCTWCNRLEKLFNMFNSDDNRCCRGFERSCTLSGFPSQLATSLGGLFRSSPVAFPNLTIFGVTARYNNAFPPCCNLNRFFVISNEIVMKILSLCVPSSSEEPLRNILSSLRFLS
jgi:hypothetical protein